MKCADCGKHRLSTEKDCKAREVKANPSRNDFTSAVFAAHRDSRNAFAGIFTGSRQQHERNAEYMQVTDIIHHSSTDPIVGFPMLISDWSSEPGAESVTFSLEVNHELRR